MKFRRQLNEAGGWKIDTDILEAISSKMVEMKLEEKVAWEGIEEVLLALEALDHEALR